MLESSLQRVPRIGDIREQEVAKVEQTGPGACERPDPVLVVQLAKKAKFTPLLLDLLGRQLGRRGFLAQRSAPIQKETNREHYRDER
jgi:hypothetical protein